MTDCLRCFNPVADTGYCPAIASRFWRYAVVAPGECWPWGGCRNNRGYGRLNQHGGQIYAHRLSWLIHRGPIPAGLFVMHRCDNPPCCNPDHLQLGTAKDNSQDAARKGRLDGRPNKKWGEEVGNSKLTAAQVHEIRRLRAEGVCRRPIAVRFGVSMKRISEITTGKAWRGI